MHPNKPPCPSAPTHGPHTPKVAGCWVGASTNCHETTEGWRARRRAAPLPPAKCSRDFDCSGANGRCIGSECVCSPGWAGSRCGQVAWKQRSARTPFDIDAAHMRGWWTWGASPAIDDGGKHHLFVSQISNDCGIHHYQTNSRIVHMTAPAATGPYTPAADFDVLPPRASHWDDGATHGVTVHRLPNRSWALYYMGFEKNWPQPTHPNCTAGSGEAWANTTFGDHAGRRIGIALSESLDGPWRRLDAPIFGPASDAWDNFDVSNPAPIFMRSGRVVLVYKGRGSRTQAMGLAFGSSPLGPFVRNDSGAAPAHGFVGGEDPFCYQDERTAILHCFTHTGNGESGAGGHAYSEDGVHWTQGEMAFTGRVQWSSGNTSVLLRRERPQILLIRSAIANGANSSLTHSSVIGHPAANGANSSLGHPSVIFTSAQDCRAPAADAGSVCRSYTMLEEVDLA